MVEAPSPVPDDEIEQPFAPTGWKIRGFSTWLGREDVSGEPMQRCFGLSVDGYSVAWIRLFVQFDAGHAPARENWSPMYADVMHALKHERGAEDEARFARRRGGGHG